MLDRKEYILDENFKVSLGRHLAHEGDNGSWQDVRLPHDLLANAPLVRGEEGGGDAQGFSACFIDATYKTTFDIKDENTYAYLIADGIYREAKIYINGQFLGGSPYGYVPMVLDASKLIKKGQNLLEVYIDNRSWRCDRWYSGAGIYRQLSLLFVPHMHVLPNSLYIKTPFISDDYTQADLDISFDIENLIENTKAKIEIYAPTGESLLSEDINLNHNKKSQTYSGKISNPCLWSPKTPNLYRAEISLCNDNKEIDRLGQTFGIRKVEFDSKKGLRLNGEPIKLCGVNLHHDSGCLGSAFFPEVWRYRLETLKNHGLNAVRASHNPQAKIFYDLCDRLGVMVIDEVYDKWYSGSYDAHFWSCYKSDVKATVTRGRNHPSIIIWSVGNELSNQGLPDFYDPLDKLVAEVRKHDSSRPVSFGMHPYGWPEEIADLSSDQKAKLTAEIFDHVDLLMCNYQEQWYEKYHKLVPDACIIGSEIYHWYTAKGETSIGQYEDHPWNYVKRLPYVIGGFYWAGIDYRGESMEWPARGWTSSLLDFTSTPRPQAKLAMAYWSDEPNVFISLIEPEPYNKYERDGWSFPHCVDHTNLAYNDGDEVEALVFTNCEAVDIYQNEDLIASQTLSDEVNCYFKFKIKWQKGLTLKAVGKNGNKELCSHTIKQAGKTENIKIEISQKTLSLRADDVSLIRISLVDADSNLCQTDDREVSINLENLELLGVDNADPASHHSYLSNKIKTFRGTCLLVVRASGLNKGIIRLKAKGLENIATGQIDII